uniref:Uncharacterized protein n=1 Tax=Sphaerodactylus townsendi TaxID=933632 RepID=A0ACB8EQ78_9SAUR
MEPIPPLASADVPSPGEGHVGRSTVHGRGARWRRRPPKGRGAEPGRGGQGSIGKLGAGQAPVGAATAVRHFCGLCCARRALLLGTGGEMIRGAARRASGEASGGMGSIGTHTLPSSCWRSPQAAAALALLLGTVGGLLHPRGFLHTLPACCCRLAKLGHLGSGPVVLGRLKIVVNSAPPCIGIFRLHGEGAILSAICKVDV